MQVHSCIRAPVSELNGKSSLTSARSDAWRRQSDSLVLRALGTGVPSRLFQRATYRLDGHVHKSGVLQGKFPSSSLRLPRPHIPPFIVLKDVSTIPTLMTRWRGVRQDSGDPFTFIGQAKSAYESMGIDYSKKIIVFSDSLENQKCLALKKACAEVGIPGTSIAPAIVFPSRSPSHSLCFASPASFGVGTFLTNDFKSLTSGERSKPMNIVIKLATINGLDCVKISDDITKVIRFLSVGSPLCSPSNPLSIEHRPKGSRLESQGGIRNPPIIVP